MRMRAFDSGFVDQLTASITCHPSERVVQSKLFCGKAVNEPFSYKDISIVPVQEM